MADTLKLTKLGQLVHRDSVMTAPSWWQNLIREVKRIQDRDGEWQLLLEERIHGMRELKDRWYELMGED